MVIISLTAIAIGVQLGFTAFLAGIMSIPIRRDQALAAMDHATRGKDGDGVLGR